MPSTVTFPSIDCMRCSTAKARASGESASVASASSGFCTQTRLDRNPPGSGTCVNGPCGVWNSVEMFWCGRLMGRN